MQWIAVSWAGETCVSPAFKMSEMVAVGFYTDMGIRQVPLSVRQTGRVFGHSCPAFLPVREFHPNFQKASRMMVPAVMDGFRCFSCILFNFQGAFQEVFPLGDLRIPYRFWYFTEKKLRTTKTVMGFQMPITAQSVEKIQLNRGFFPMV